MATALVSCGDDPAGSDPGASDKPGDGGNPDGGNPDGGNPDGGSTDDEDDELKGLVFIAKNSTECCVDITEAKETREKIVIPEYYDGYKVVEISAVSIEPESGSYPLSEIIIPSSVTVIGESAFAYCKNITAFALSDSVCSIEKNAFAYSGIKYFEIGSGCESVHASAFVGCSELRRISVSNENKVLSSNGTSLVSNGKVLLICAMAAGDTLTIPSNIIGFGNDPFPENSTVKNIVLPEEMISISASDLEGCKALKNVYYEGGSENAKLIESSLSSLGVTVFAYSEKEPYMTGNFWHRDGDGIAIWPECRFSTGLSYSSNGSDECFVKDIGSCKDSVIIVPPVSPDGKKVTGFDDGAFENCTNITEVILPDTIGYIGDSLFIGCKSLKKVTFLGQANYISYRMFYGCSSLEEISIPNGAELIGNEAFYGCTALKTVSIPDSIYKIGDRAFKECKSLKEIRISDGVTKIGEGSFENCLALEKISIGKSLESIASGAFDYCEKLMEITVNEENSALFAEDNVLYGDGGKTLIYYASGISTQTFVMPESVTLIKKSAFHSANHLVTVVFSSCPTVENDAFMNCLFITNVYYFGLPEQWAENGMHKTPLGVKGKSVYYHSDRQLLSDAPFWHFVDGEIEIWPEAKISKGFTYGYWSQTGVVLTGLGSCNDTVLIIPEYTKDFKRVEAINGLDYLQKVTKVVVPNSVKVIGRSFTVCPKLVELILPDTLIEIGDYTMVGLECLTEINLAADFRYLGEGSLWDCPNLKAINVAPGSGYYWSEDGVLYSGEGYAKTLVMYPVGRKDTSFTVPEGTAYISAYAFRNCTALTEINLPASLRLIETSAFLNCSGIVKLEFSEGLEKICGRAFLGCGTFESVKLPSTLTSVDTSAFGEVVIKELIITSCNTVYWYGAFGMVENIVIPVGFGVYNDYVFVKDGYFETNVFYLGNEDEWSKESIENTGLCVGKIYYFSESKPETSGNFWYYEGDSIIVWPDYVPGDGLVFESVGDGKCILVGRGDCSDVELRIPELAANGERVVGIGSGAFKNWTELRSVYIPASIESIYANAFDGCSSLVSFEVENTSASFKSADGILYTASGNILLRIGEGTSLEFVSVLAGTSEIGDRAFAGCKSVKTVILPDSVMSVGSEAFSGCTSLSAVYYEGNNFGKVSADNSSLDGVKVYSYRASAPEEVGDFWYYVGSTPAVWPEYVPPKYSEGLVFVSNGDGTCALVGLGDCLDSEILIPTRSPDGDRVTSIKAGAFVGGETRIVNIEIPESIMDIERGAFSGLQNLVYYGYGDCNYLGNSNNRYLWLISTVSAHKTKYNIYSDTKHIFADAFSTCVLMSSISLPKNLLTIGDGAFKNCVSLNVITIPDNLVSIGEGAFESCMSLTSVTIGKSVENIGDRAFYVCSSLKSITVNTENQFFTSVNGSLYTKDGKTLVMFAVGTKPECANVPEGVEVIGKYAFAYGIEIKKIVLPSTLVSIEEYAFEFCFAVTEINLPEGLKSIGSRAFKDCYGITSIKLPDGIEFIGEAAFESCKGIASMTVSDSNAYYITIDGCLFTEDKSVLLFVPSIYKNSAIVIPDGVKRIGDSAFSALESISSVNIGDGIESIGSYAFMHATPSEVIFRGSEAKWNGISFEEGNDNLKGANITFAI